MIPRFVLMCGLPASGKSTKAQEFSKAYNATVFSSDALREELYGDANIQGDNTKLFTELHRRIKDCLRDNKSAVYDATNIDYKKRMAFLAELKNIPCTKICVIMATPYEECLKRNAQRERKVPERVIKRMYMNFFTPAWFEGWDNIKIVYSENSVGYYGTLEDFLNDYENYDQHNHHHEFTLSNHCKAAHDYLIDESDVLKYAALIHDCGKPETATFQNRKGETTEDCHYYNHNNVAGLKALFYEYGDTSALDVAILCCWHMQPYFNKEEKTKEKYKKIWGEELHSNLMKLHAADVNAH